MQISPRKTIAAVGMILVGLSAVCLIAGGWMIMLCLPRIVFQAFQGHLEEIALICYGLGILLALVTGLTMLMRSKSVWLMTLITLPFAFIAGSIWLAVGTWPMINFANSGSAQGTIKFGSRILVDGEFAGVSVNPAVWALKACIYAVILTLATLAFLRFLRRDDVQAILVN